MRGQGCVVAVTGEWFAAGGARVCELRVWLAGGHIKTFPASFKTVVGRSVRLTVRPGGPTAGLRATSRRVRADANPAQIWIGHGSPRTKKRTSIRLRRHVES